MWRECVSASWRMLTVSWRWSILVVISCCLCPDFSVRHVDWGYVPLTPALHFICDHPCCKGDEFPKFTYSNLSDASLSRGSLSKKQIVLCLSLFSINRFNVSFQNQLIWLGYTLSVVHLDMEGDPSSIIICPFALLCCTYCKYPLRRMADFSVYRTIIRGYLCW
jgi:hypothetical protein